MPECVEVSLTALWLNSNLKNRSLNDINVLKGRYKKQKIAGLTTFKANAPFKVISIGSKGKVIWIHIKNKQNVSLYIFNRFGLTGEWHMNKDKFSAIELQFDNLSAYFSDMRNFGTIEIVDKITLDTLLNKLGDDFLMPFDCDDFYTRLNTYATSDARKKQPIIKILMDQAAVGSGIGNYLAAEILYHAKMSPYTKLKILCDSKILSNRLCKSIKYVIKLVYFTDDSPYVNDPELKKFIEKERKKTKTKNAIHPDVKLKLNDKFTFNVYGQNTDPDGNKVNQSKIIPGRTTYWSPVQV